MNNIFDGYIRPPLSKTEYTGDVPALSLNLMTDSYFQQSLMVTVTATLRSLSSECSSLYRRT